MGHIAGQRDADLHNEDGSHRSTARTADGRDLERQERRIRTHLALHQHFPSKPPTYHQGEPLMFDTGDNTYRSDLKLGERYRDRTTGIEGHLVALHFFEHACERGSIRYVDQDRNVQEVAFDAPELVHVESGVAATSTRAGGPARATGRRSYG